MSTTYAPLYVLARFISRASARCVVVRLAACAAGATRAASRTAKTAIRRTMGMSRLRNPQEGRKSRPTLALRARVDGRSRPEARSPTGLRLVTVSNVVEMNAPARRKRRSSRTALVLGGGGFTGGVYQIGALRALDLLSSNRSVNQFDVYVGTSAGALIASLVANGITPEQMMRTVNDQAPTPLPILGREQFLRLNKAEFALRALQFPLHAVSVARRIAGSLGSLSAVDMVMALGDALPSG